MLPSIYQYKSEILNFFQEFIKDAFDGLKSSYHYFNQFPKSYSFLIYLFVAMSFCYYPIFNHWIAGFIMMTLPIALLFGFFASGFLWFKKQKMIATIGMVWGFVFIANSETLRGCQQRKSI